MKLPTIVVRGDVLASWLMVSDCTKSRFATELGVSKGRISQLLTSQEEPSAHLMAKLLILTRLPFDRLFQVLPSSSPSPSSFPSLASSSASSSSGLSGRPQRPGRRQRRTPVPS